MGMFLQGFVNSSAVEERIVITIREIKAVQSVKNHLMVVRKVKSSRVARIQRSDESTTTCRGFQLNRKAVDSPMKKPANNHRTYPLKKSLHNKMADPNTSLSLQTQIPFCNSRVFNLNVGATPGQRRSFDFSPFIHAVFQEQHYHQERDHQGRGYVLPFPSPRSKQKRDHLIQCRKRFGGLLKYCCQRAA